MCSLSIFLFSHAIHEVSERQLQAYISGKTSERGRRRRAIVWRSEEESHCMKLKHYGIVSNLLNTSGGGEGSDLFHTTIFKMVSVSVEN